MTALPKVRFANSDIEVTRLISGGNPLCGNSHYSEAMSADMREYFTPERVVAYLQDLERHGVNTLQARGDYHRVLYWIELFRRQGGQLHWIAQTASEMADVRQNIRVLTAAGAAGIYFHGSRTDRWWLEGRIDEVEDFLKLMRDCGVQVGLGTHTPEVIDYAEDQGWDVDFYMTCFYNLNREPRESALVAGKPTQGPADIRFEPQDPPAMCERIRATDKMCLAFKILGASRLCQSQDSVREAFRFAFAQIKAKDAVVVGMFPKRQDQIALNVEHVLAVCGDPDHGPVGAS